MGSVVEEVVVSRHLFSEHHLGEILNGHLQKARAKIDELDENYLLNASEADLIAYFVSEYTVNPPELGEPYIAESKEANVDVRYHPDRYIFDDGRPVYAKGTRLEIHVPYTGDAFLFHCAPSTYSLSPPQADVRQSVLAFTYETAGEMNSEQIKQSFNHSLGQVRSSLQHTQTDCAKFNGDLENQIRQIVAGRKNRLLKSRQAVANIGLPMKRREDAATTYTVPNVRRKPQIQMPVVKDKAFILEPALANEEYEHILSVIRSMVKVMERSPHSFQTMGEEDLRTHFLVPLNGQYEGRASGETFNYEGKTDILIRDGDRNVFIAECKIWKGEAELVKALDQILGYLHWRDTKAALIVFNRNKSFSDVLAKIEPTVAAHPSCKKLSKKLSETEWRFVFGNKDDPNRELQLAVLLFDVPKAP
jgi:hypothetical protein